MELVEPPAPANKYDYRLEDSDHEDETGDRDSSPSPERVGVHVDDPNGFVDKSSVAFGHNPDAKPKKSAFSMASAFSFKRSKSTNVRGSSVLAETTGGEARAAKGKGIKFASKKHVREITGRSRSQKARTRELEEEGSSCSVM